MDPLDWWEQLGFPAALPPMLLIALFKGGGWLDVEVLLPLRQRQQQFPARTEELLGLGGDAETARFSDRAGAPKHLPDGGAAGREKPRTPCTGGGEERMRRKYFGWVEDPTAAEAVARTLATPLFGDTPAGTDPAPLPDHAYLWKACRQMLGNLIPPREQGSLVSCVDFGTVAAI